jgi:hypothetical protein
MLIHSYPELMQWSWSCSWSTTRHFHHEGKKRIYFLEIFDAAHLFPYSSITIPSPSQSLATLALTHHEAPSLTLKQSPEPRRITVTLLQSLGITTPQCHLLAQFLHPYGALCRTVHAAAMASPLPLLSRREHAPLLPCTVSINPSHQQASPWPMSPERYPYCTVQYPGLFFIIIYSSQRCVPCSILPSHAQPAIRCI